MNPRSSHILPMLALLAGLPTFAALIAFEDFESYTPGTQLEDGAGTGLNGGTGWNSDWEVRDSQRTAVTIDTAALSYSRGSVTVSGGANVLRYTAIENNAVQELLSREFAPAQSGTLYLSFLYREVSNGDDDFIQFGFDDSVLPNPATTALDRNGNFQARSGTSSTSDSGIPSVLGQTYFLVLKISNSGGNYNNVSVFVDPTSAVEGIPDATNNTDSGLASAFHFAVRSAFYEIGDTVNIDELRIGTTWEDVVPSVVSPIIYEGFESYTAGSQLNGGFGGTGWLGNWIVNGARTAEVTVESVALSYTAGFVNVDGGGQALQYVSTETGISQMFSRQLSAQAGTLYLSFLYRNTVDGETDTNDFWQFGFDTSSLPNPQATVLDRDNEFQGRAGLSSANSFPAVPPHRLGNESDLLSCAQAREDRRKQHLQLDAVLRGSHDGS